MLNPILSKLQKLYSSLDELKSSGEDVVRDIKKEINNLELEYLKEIVFPNISKQLGKELANLRCQLDMSFQYDGDKNIDYSFCTSNSGMLFRDKYTVTDTSDYSDIDEAPLYASEDTTPITSPTPDEDSTYEPILYLEEYSERSIVVYGDTKPYSDTFKARGGYFNPRLKVGPGWIFSKRREPELRSIIKFADYKQKEEPSLFEPISESSTGNIIPSIKSVDYYINAFDRMKNVTVQKITGPHKAIFLLTIFEAIRTGIIKDEKVYLNSKFLSLHDKLWKQYVPSKAPFLCNICQPFIHLASEDFFKLDLKCEITNINKNWTVSGVKSVCNYGILDKELFLLAQDSNHRKTLAMHLISRYCAPLRDISPVKTNSSKPDPEGTAVSLDSYRTYLANSTNHNGNRYSPSSIGVYSTALKSDYLESKVKRYRSDGKILNVTDPRIISAILKDVTADFQIGNTSSGSVASLKLYLQFMQDFADNPAVVHRVNEPTAIQKMREANRVIIKSIKTSEFTISEGNPTDMFVEFVSLIGPDLVSEMEINWLGAPLVSLIPNQKYLRSSKQLPGGYWVNTNSSTTVKISQMEEIAHQLNISINIEYA